MRKRLFSALLTVIIGIQSLSFSAAGEELILEESLTAGEELEENEVIVAEENGGRFSDEAEIFSVDNVESKEELLLSDNIESEEQLLNDGSYDMEEIQSVGASISSKDAITVLKDYLVRNGSHYSYDLGDIYSINISLDTNYSKSIGISYDSYSSIFNFDYMDSTRWDYLSESGTSISVNMSVPYNLTGSIYINSTETRDDYQNYNSGSVSVRDYSTINIYGNNTLNFRFWELNFSNQQDARTSANANLSTALRYWDDTIWSRAGITLESLGFGETSLEELEQPVLIAAYNGAKGIGIKFFAVEQAAEYVIYRKFNGVWSYICTVDAEDPDLQINGNQIMYTDTTVARNYGKGYIYSVAAKNGGSFSTYDTKGAAIYRLTPPALIKITNSAAGAAEVTWKGVFGKTETNGNYDLQYAEYKDGKAGEFQSVITRPGYNNQTLSAAVKGLKKGSRYVFRIRCSKTNKDRGTYYSEYSPWLSVTIGK